jgi:elongation factor 1-gamma
VDFKFPEELTQTFMSNNQIGGFFNRLEASRKYLFGSVGVLGAANASLISGALILRGQDAIPVVSVAPDWESYEFKKLDLGNEKDKAFFEAALAWDLEIDGKKWVDGKNVSLVCPPYLRTPLTSRPVVQVTSSRSYPPSPRADVGLLGQRRIEEE